MARLLAIASSRATCAVVDLNVGQELVVVCCGGCGVSSTGVATGFLLDGTAQK